jgi:caa(3)-type oxidase subunit IV
MADSHHHPTPETVPPAHSHGAHDDAAHVAAHVRTYLIIGGILMFLTLVTVGLSYWDFGSHHMNIIVAMIVATGKASLVAAVFMHLKGERATIWRFLIFTAIFVAGLFFLTLLHETDPIMGTFYNKHD